MTGWRITIFNRKYIFIHGGFSSQVMIVFGGVNFDVKGKIEVILNTLFLRPYFLGGGSVKIGKVVE